MARNDPAFEEKAADIIGLYLDPPQHAVVFCVDEKTAIQALDRSRCCRCRPDAETHGFEYYRHGTLSLYAALDVKTGKVHGKTACRHTSADFIGFLADIVERSPAGKEIHIVLDNLSVHRAVAPAVGDERRRRIGENFVVAFLQSIGAKTLYRWMGEPEFETAYREAKRSAFSQAIARLHQMSSAAVTTLGKAMLDVRTPPATRVRAAHTILEQTAKAIEIEGLEARLTVLERSTPMGKEKK